MKDLTDKQLLQATFEEVGMIKEQITENEFEAEKSREEMNDKLDKILEVVSEKISSHQKRIKNIEDHLGFTTFN